MAEPTTALTDWVLAAVAAWLGVRLSRSGSREGTRARILFGGTLLALAATAACGGAYHALRSSLDVRLLSAIWKLTVYGAGLTSFLFVLGAARASVGPRWRLILYTLAAIALGIYGVWMWTRDSFLWVVAHSLTSFGLVLLLESVSLLRGSPGSGWIVSSIVVFLAGAAVQQSGLDLHPAFNHNDLYHVIQTAGVFLLYRGARVARDEGSATAPSPIVLPVMPAPRSEREAVQRGS